MNDDKFDFGTTSDILIVMWSAELVSHFDSEECMLFLYFCKHQHEKRSGFGSHYERSQKILHCHTCEIYSPESIFEWHVSRDTFKRTPQVFCLRLFPDKST
jgi:hypothetical protein